GGNVWVSLRPTYVSYRAFCVSSRFVCVSAWFHSVTFASRNDPLPSPYVAFEAGRKSPFVSIHPISVSLHSTCVSYRSIYATPSSHPMPFLCLPGSFGLNARLISSLLRLNRWQLCFNMFHLSGVFRVISCHLRHLIYSDLSHCVDFASHSVSFVCRPWPDGFH